MRGEVVVDRVDVRQWDLPAVRRHVGVVHQDPVLFTGSVDANQRPGLEPRGVAGEG